MQTLFYIAVAYIISALLILVALIIYYYNEHKTTMVKTEFYRVFLLSIVPVFNILLLFGILAIEFYELLINLKNKFWKK